MKKRNHVRRSSAKSQRGSLLDLLTSPKRARKSWTFERLEDRHLFSATPLQMETQTLSSSTLEGQLALLQREIEWLQAQQSGGAASVSTSSGSSAYNAYLRALPTDPLLFPDATDPARASQWHLINTGQEVGNPDYQVIFGVPGEDINVLPVWQGDNLQQAYSGAGVVVAVIDSGVQLNHSDLAANISGLLRYDAITGDNDPSPGLGNPDNAHGTAVAGLIAADDNGVGGVGVAYNATIAPIRLVDTGLTSAAIVRAFRYAIDQIDITNNSWGPADDRTAINIDPAAILALRDSILFGRGGLGVIHVWASGNGAGPGFSEPFQSIGSMDVSNYDPFVNSRYTIGVTGVDHDGLYYNVDGTFTAYPEIGTAVLVAAPTGSNAFLNVADDTGLGSGIVTTDFTGDNGYNQSPLDDVEIDRDFLADTNYTSRFNGTSAAAPIVSGVIALMLEANPNLNWRDVQEILVRSARQNAQFENPESGAGFVSNNTWQTNQLSFFQDPDLFQQAGPSPDGLARSMEVYSPVADPAMHHTQMWTNGAGYTVSMGYGVYGESIGYAHGVVDAALAVKMAENWHTLGQNRKDEKTFSTFVVNLLADLPGAEKANNDAGQLLVPGMIGGDGGFIDFWNEYFVDDDPANADDGPFSGDDPPDNTRGSFLEYEVPDIRLDGTTNAMTVENVEFTFGISGPSDDLDGLKITLVSPEGTFSEFNPFGADASFNPFSLQQFNNINLTGDLGNLDPDGGSWTWTFNTNRSWGERTTNALIIDPATGEPAVHDTFVSPLGGSQEIPTTGPGTAYGTKGWRVIIENWSNSDFVLDAVELTFHGNPIQAGTQRVQGIVGVDDNDNGEFNFNRYNQANLDFNGDPLVYRLGEVQRTLDLTQESFGENYLVSAYQVVDGVEQSDPEAQFVTGHDGNYYFDLIPGEYIIRAVDLDDPLADPEAKFKNQDSPDDLMPEFLAEWHITEEWFTATEMVDVDPDDILTDLRVQRDVVTGAPVQFVDGDGASFEYGPRYLNFLVDRGNVPLDQVEISGSVIADLNGDGVLNGDDAPAAGFSVYHDANRNNARDAGEALFAINSDGTYTITVETTTTTQIAIGVVASDAGWTPTNPLLGVQSVYGGPGETFANVDFYFQPPEESTDPAGTAPGDILGVIFSDRDSDGIRDSGEDGVAGFRVYVDANENGAYDAGEINAITSANGAYFLSNVPKGAVRIDVEVPASWSLTSPIAGFRELTLPAGGTITNVLFGVRNLATADWGDLPDSYGTSGVNGARHEINPGFRLGAKIDGEVNGQPTSDAMGDDAVFGDEDGVVLLGAASNPTGVLVGGTTNMVQVTVFGVGGYLNAWMDFNNDGDFDDAGEHVALSDGAVGDATFNLDINPGIHTLRFATPANMAGGSIAARFRWGNADLGYSGAAGIGEVEDYYFANINPVPLAAAIPGDYDGSGMVDAIDYSVWKTNFGSTSNLAADGNGNGVVDTGDYTVWRDHVGQGSPAGGGSGGISYGSTNSGSPSAPVDLETVLAALQNKEVSPAMAARLESLGYVPVTMRVGATGTRTVYVLPSAALSGGGGGGAVAEDSDVVVRGGSGGSTSTSSASDLASSIVTTSFDVAATSFDSTTPAATAESVDSALLLWATSSSARDLSPRDEELGEAARWNEEGADEQEALDLALAAAFEDAEDWRNCF